MHKDGRRTRSAWWELLMLGLLVTVLHSDSRVPVWMPWVLLRKEVRRLVDSVSGATRQNSGVAAACGDSREFWQKQCHCHACRAVSPSSACCWQPAQHHGQS